MLKGYTNRQEIENYLLIDIDPSFYDQVDRWIAQMEAFIDKGTGRNFVCGDEYEKVFDGDGSPKLLIDDAVSISSVKIGDGDNLIDDSGDGLYFYPANRTNPDRPITNIKGECFTRGKQNIKITGKWGYSEAVPDDIKFAATVLTAGIINFSLNAEGEVQSMTIGRYSVTYKTQKQWQDFEEIQNIIDGYVKYST